MPTVSQVLMPQIIPVSSVNVEAHKEEEVDEKPWWVYIAGTLLFQHTLHCPVPKGTEVQETIYKTVPQSQEWQ